MMIRLLFLTLSTFCGLAMAQDRIDLNEYFDYLDYLNPAKKEKLLEYEAQFMKLLISTRSKRPEDIGNEEAKEILYGTLFLTNTNQGIRFKHIGLDELTQNGKLSIEDCPDLKSEMLAREELILDNLKLAKKIFPDDYRIDAWIGTHELIEEQFKYGKVKDETFDKVVSLAKENIFSYTALAIVANELVLSNKQSLQIVELAQLVSDNKIPCVKNENGHCFETSKAPNTSEIGKLMTADIFLKEADQHVQGSQDLKGARIKSGVKARVIYGLLDQNKKLKFKRDGFNHIYLNKRVKAANKLLWNQKPVSHELMTSDEFNRGYTCIACHSGGKP